MKLKFILLIAFLSFALSAMALPPTGGDILDDYDDVSFLICADYDTKTMGGSFGIAVPIFKLPMGRLYVYTLGDIGSDIQTLEAKGVYLFDLKILDMFIGVTAGPESDWLSIPEGSSAISYISGAGGIMIGRAWNNWGLIFHYEKVIPIDKESNLETMNSIKLGLYLDIF